MKRIFKILMKVVLGLLLIIVIAFATLKIAFNEDIPQGVPGKPADELAMKMLDAINYDAYKKARKLEWTFRGKNHYEWYPQENKVMVSWDNFKVELFTQNPNTSIAFKNGKELSGNNKKDAIDYALENFNNDSFWIVAPFKVMDPGTEREIIKEDAQEKLLVRYINGGTTPGDVYVWKLDKNHRPQNYKMWVDIIPLDGVEAKWEDWQMTEGGFPLAMKKSIFGVEIPVTNLAVDKTEFP